MSKHEKSFIPDTIDPDLLRRTESAILDYMEKHEGKMPTQHEVNETVKTSFTRLGPAIRAVKTRLFATQTKLANMPEIPEDLRQAHEQMLKELWARTRELQNGEIVELRQAQAEKDRTYQREVADLEQVISLIEGAQKRECERADAVEAECKKLREQLEEVTAELAQARGRLAERDFILRMLPSSPAEESNSRKSTTRKGAPDESDTGDLFQLRPEQGSAEPSGE